MFAFYDQPYIEYDKRGITQVNCIRCNDAIKVRVLNEETGGYSFKTLNVIEVIPFELSNGSYTNLFFCTDCKKEYQETEEELEGMSTQFKSGFELEARAAKKSEKHIKKMKKRYKNIKVKKGHQKGGGKK